MNSLVTDQQYLAVQYQTSANLSTRFSLHERYSTNPLPWHRWVFDQLNLPRVARVLEVGCGPGWLWRQNLDRLPPAGRSPCPICRPAWSRKRAPNMSHPGFWE